MSKIIRRTFATTALVILFAISLVGLVLKVRQLKYYKSHKDRLAFLYTNHPKDATEPLTSRLTIPNTNMKQQPLELAIATSVLLLVASLVRFITYWLIPQKPDGPRKLVTRLPTIFLILTTVLAVASLITTFVVHGQGRNTTFFRTDADELVLNNGTLHPSPYIFENWLAAVNQTTGYTSKPLVWDLARAKPVRIIPTLKLATSGRILTITEAVIAIMTLMVLALTRDLSTPPGEQVKELGSIDETPVEERKVSAENGARQ